MGIITKAVIVCPPLPRYQASCLLKLSSFENCLDVWGFIQSNPIRSEVAAFEFWDSESNALVTLPDSYYNILIELHSADPNIKGRLEEVAGELLKRRIVEDDSVLSQDEQQAQEMMQWREDIPVKAVSTPGALVLKYDISLPLKHFYEIVEKSRQILKGQKATVIGYGHLGDGNLHLNVIAEKSTADVVKSLMEPWVYEWTAAHCGSISAEHGIGYLKKQYLKLAKDSQTIDLFRSIKQSFDPHLILNPYKLFD